MTEKPHAQTPGSPTVPAGDSVGAGGGSDLGRLLRVQLDENKRLRSKLACLNEEILKRERFEKQLLENRERFALLADTASQLLHSPNPQKIIDSLCHKTMRHLDCHAFFNFLVNKKAGKLHLNTCGGISDEQSSQIEWLDYDMGVCGRVAQEGKMVVAEHIATSTDSATQLVKSFGLRAYASFPLVGEDGKTMGTLSFGTRSRDVFSAEDVELMRAVADQVSSAMNRMRYERRLRAKGNLLQTIYDSIPVILSIYDPEQKDIFLNKAFERITGWSLEEARETNVLNLVYPDSAYREEISGFMDSLRPGFKDITMTTKSGRTIQTSWANIEISDGRRVGIGIDISDRKRLERQIAEKASLAERKASELIEKNKELESFSYSLSHDLRNPLQATGMFAQFLREDYDERLDEDGSEFVRQIVYNTEKMNALIDDMLALSRISRQEMTMQEIDLSSIAQSVFKDLQYNDPDRQVEISIASCAAAYGDSRLLTIALSNLVANAWKYTGRTDRPRIEFGLVNDESVIMNSESVKNSGPVYFIRDNGAGFPMEQAARLFTPFQRLHSDKEFRGTGIGLAIVKRVISRHGGDIWAESQQGKGATFWFTLGSRT